MNDARTGFENLRVYQLADRLGDLVWQIVRKWERFSRDTLGKQLLNSADSVAANIAEGTGRGSFADNKRFAKIARGSLFEVKHWFKKAERRGLLSESEGKEVMAMVDELIPRLSAYINSIGK